MKTRARWPAMRYRAAHRRPTPTWRVGSKLSAWLSLILIAAVMSLMPTPQAHADATISVIDSNSAKATAATSVTVSTPGNDRGDFLIAMVNVQASATTPADDHPVLTAPAGWIKLGTSVHGTTNSAVFWKFGDGDDSEPDSYKFTSSISGWIGAAIVSYDNVDNSIPIEFYAGGSDGATGTSHTTQTTNVNRTGQWVLALFGDSTSTTAKPWTAPSGYTLNQSNGTTAKNQFIMTDDHGTTSVGSTSATATTSTQSSATANAFILVLNPTRSTSGGSISVNKVVASSQNVGASSTYTATIASPISTAAKCIKATFNSWLPGNSSASLPYGMTASSPTLTGSTSVTGASWGTGTVTNNSIKWTYATGQTLSGGTLVMNGITNPLRDTTYGISFNTYSDTSCTTEIDAGTGRVAVFDPISSSGVTQTLLTTAGTSISITKPAGAGANDIAIAVISLDAAATITPPGGWTTVQATSASQATGIYTKLITTSDSWPYSFTWTGSTTAVATNTTYAGVDITTPIANNAVATTESSSTSHATTAVTVSAGQWLVGIFADASACGVYTAPGGYYERNEARQTSHIQVYDAGANYSTGSTTVTATTASSCANNLKAALTLNPNTTAVQFVSSSGANDEVSSDSVTVSRPQRVIANQLMIAVVTTDSGDFGESVTTHGPVGWTALNRGTHLVSGNSNQVTVFWRMATNDEPSTYTFTRDYASQSNNISVAIAVYANTDPNMPIDAYAIDGDGSVNKNHISTAVWAERNNEMLVAFWSDAVSTNTGAAMTTSTTGATMRLNQIGRVDNSFLGLTGIADFYEPNNPSTQQITAVGNTNSSVTVSGGLTLFPRFTTSGSTMSVTSVIPSDPRASRPSTWDITVASPKATTAKCIRMTFRSNIADAWASIQEGADLGTTLSGSTALSAASWGTFSGTNKNAQWTNSSGQILSNGIIRLNGVTNPRVAGLKQLLIETFSDTGCTAHVDTTTTTINITDTISFVGSTSVSHPEGSCTVDIQPPAGIQPGDVIVGVTGNDGGDLWNTIPTYWARVWHNDEIAYWYHMYSASDTLPYTFTISTCDRSEGYFAAYRGVHPVHYYSNGSTTFSDPSTGTHSITGITPSSLNQWMIGLYGGGMSLGTPTQNIQPTVDRGYALAGDETIGILDTDGPAMSTSSTDLTWTSNDTDVLWGAYAMLLNPYHLESFTTTPSNSYTTAPAPISYTHAFTETPNTTLTKCIAVDYNPGSGSLPTGMAISSPTLTGSTAITDASWGTGTVSGSKVLFTNTSGEYLRAGNFVVNGITHNPTGTGSRYDRITTYTSTDCTTGEIEYVNSATYGFTAGSPTPTLSFSVASQSTSCNGATFSAGSSNSATSVNFGHVMSGSSATSGQQLSITTNATSGYSIRMQSPATLSDGHGHTISVVSGTNGSPGSAPSGSGWGYTTNDSTLNSSGGLANRFTNPSAKWAAPSSTPGEIAYDTTTASGATSCIGYKVAVDPSTPPGTYTASVAYSAVAIH